MRKQLIFTFAIGMLLYSCKIATPINTESSKQDSEFLKLRNRAMVNLDSSKWNKKLFKQDIETHNKYAKVFEEYPLNNYPFPVADYDYAVYSNPFTIKKDSLIFKGIQVGEYKNSESEEIITKLVLLVLTNNDKIEPETFIDSRNFPYLTAEGNFPFSDKNYYWVFQSTPDGFTSLFFSMKLFDLRFGQTVVIYPNSDHSFFYDQINESPNNFSKFDDYLIRIKEKISHKK